MPLAGYTPERRVIEIGHGNSFFVKGLSMVDLTILVRTHLTDADLLFEMFKDTDKLKNADLQPLIMGMLGEAPGLCANIIALAAGEGDATDASRLSFPVQMQALLDIADLTFRDVGGPGKCWEMIANLLASVKKS